MSASNNIEYQDPWSKNKQADLPFGFEPTIVTSFANKALLFSARWRSETLIAPTSNGPWSILHPNTNKQEPLTTDHWKIVHPGIQYLDITDWHNLTGTYNEKNFRWSSTQNRFVYDNNRPVTFPIDEEGKAAEVSQLLESSRQTLERTAAKLTPEATPSTLPGALPETPQKPPPTVSTSKGKQSARTTVQQPTPLVSKAAPSMSSTASAKVLGTTLEAFDRTTSKAKGFLGALKTYYYLNESLYLDKFRRVAPALMHFKVGTPAGEWAYDRQDTAQKQNTIDYGIWDDFLKAFKNHFIPVQSAQQAMNALWTVKMCNCPFHKWYQEWSTYASRSEANDAIKMYAFCQALPQGLNDKLIGVTPAPTTLNDLVKKARSFDQQWQMWRHTTGNPSTPQRNQGTCVHSNATDDANVNLADTANPHYKKLTPEQCASHLKNGECLYCGQKNQRGSTPGNHCRRNQRCSSCVAHLPRSPVPLPDPRTC